MSPGGGTLWAQDGAVRAEELSSVLDECLYPSPPATASAVQVEREWSLEAVAGVVGAAHMHPPHAVMRPCPATFTVGPGDIGLVVSGVTFVHKDAASSRAEMERLRTDNAERGAEDPGVLVVVDGATDSDARRLADELGPAFMVVPDADGAIAAGAGIRYWPTTVTLGNEQGVQH